jgi:hypothetical protein
MNFKPADFFIGVENFFAILLPGALATYLLQRFFGAELQPLFGAQNSADSMRTVDQTAGGLSFLFIAYGVGHVTSAVGGLLDELIFNFLHDKILRPEKEQLLNQLIGQAHQILQKQFLLEGNKDSCSPTQAPLKYLKGVHTWQWAAMLVNLQQPEAGAELARIKADAKFLRNLIPVLVFSCYVTWRLPYASYILTLLHLSVIAILSIRCIFLRRKYRKLAYCYLVAIQRMKSKEATSPAIILK